MKVWKKISDANNREKKRIAVPVSDKVDFKQRKIFTETFLTLLAILALGTLRTL